MAVVLTPSWQTIANVSWSSGAFSCTYWLDAKYSFQTADGNYSLLDVRLTCTKTNNAYGVGYEFGVSYGPTVSGNGTYTILNQPDGVVVDGTTIAGYGVPIYHNADGTKSLSLSAKAVVRGLGMYLSLAGDVIFPTIPRASVIGNKTLNIGESSTISWSRASSNFTHTLKYSFGTSTFNTIGTNLATSATWTPPTSLYQYFPNARQGSGKLDLTTFNGSTNIGYTRSTLTLKAVESNANPVINSVTYSDINTTTTNITGDNSYIVAGKSTLRVNVSFSTRLYSTLKSITINGVDYTNLAVAGTSSGGTTPYTLQKDITNYKGNKITVVVTDTREYSKTSETTISHYINYVAVSSNADMKRTQPTNGVIAIRFSGDYFNSSFNTTANTLTIRYRYKKSSATSWSSYTTISASNYHKISNKYYSGSTSSSTTPEYINLGSSFDYREDYNFQVQFYDKFTTITKSITVQKGIPIVNWNKTKFRVNGNLEVEGSVTIGNKVLDLGTTIYETSSPSTGATLTLTDSIANYKRIVIYAVDGELENNYSTEVYNNGSSSVDFVMINGKANYSSTNPIHITLCNININGTTLTKGYRAYMNTTTNSLNASASTGGTYTICKIEKIVGYKDV